MSGKCFPAYELNRLAREQMKQKLLIDILTDMKVCELEGWDMLEYTNDLKILIDNIVNRHNGPPQTSKHGG